MYEGSSLFRFSGKAGDTHRVFVFSADLFSESGSKPWAATPDLPGTEADVFVKWLLSNTSQEDVLLLCDGLSRISRLKLETLVLECQPRNLPELWVVYRPSRRLGRRVSFAAENGEVLLLSTAVDGNRLSAKERSAFNAVGEASTHDTTYTGVQAMPWGAMPRVSLDDKAKILGHKSEESPPGRIFDASMGVPLFWAERKTAKFWTQILEDLDGRAVFDLTPGTGSLARACLGAGIQYAGVARN